MLKRTQIMLNDWLVDYVKSIVKEYGLSFSEVVRISLCLEFIKLVSSSFPEYKPKVSDKDLMKIIDGVKTGSYSREELHRFISDVYFEGRKAAELKMNASPQKKSKK